VSRRDEFFLAYSCNFSLGEHHAYDLAQHRLVGAPPTGRLFFAAKTRCLGERLSNPLLLRFGLRHRWRAICLRRSEATL